MKNLHLLSFALVVAASAVPAVAQQNAALAPMPAMTASMPMSMPMPMHEDCAKAPMKRHDHGAERGVPTSETTGSNAMAMPCPAAGAASAISTATKPKLRHDHAKFHKNQ